MQQTNCYFRKCFWPITPWALVQCFSGERPNSLQRDVCLHKCNFRTNAAATTYFHFKKNCKLKIKHLFKERKSSIICCLRWTWWSKLKFVRLCYFALLAFWAQMSFSTFFCSRHLKAELYPAVFICILPSHSTIIFLCFFIVILLET